MNIMTQGLFLLLKGVIYHIIQLQITLIAGKSALSREGDKDEAGEMAAFDFHTLATCGGMVVIRNFPSAGGSECHGRVLDH